MMAAKSFATKESLDTSSTLKRNPKMELSKADLLKLLSYLEGELQAREVVIAALKAEQVKQLLHQNRYGGYSMEDPLAALQRDAFAACSPGFDEASVRIAYSNQLLSLENLIDAQQRAQLRLHDQIQQMQLQQAKVLVELDDERRKHAQDTAQGDDVTYLLEKERERLKQEVEMEKQQNRKLEKELRRVVAVLEQDRTRQKHIVLLLLAERKRIATRMLEERQRCDEFQQILQLEKGHMADMVDGLEEESQKSLQMEAELERHLAQCDAEQSQLRQSAATESQRAQQLQEENERLHEEVATLQAQLAASTLVPPVDGSQPDATSPGLRVASTKLPGSMSPKPAIPPLPPAKPSSLQTIAKPIPAPVNNAGIRLSAGPGIQVFWSGSAPVSPRPSDSVVSTITRAVGAAPPGSPATSRPVQGPVRSMAYAVPAVDPTPGVQGTPRVSVTAGPGTRVITSAQGGKLTFHVTASPVASTGTMQPPPQPPRKTPGVGRGTPPPVPPNKPVLPPQTLAAKKEAQLKLGLSRDKASTPDVEGTQLLPADSPQVGGGKDDDDDDDNVVATYPAAPLPQPPAPSMDLLGQELADFQQLLVSMVAGGSAGVAPQPSLFQTCTATAKSIGGRNSDKSGGVPSVGAGKEGIASRLSAGGPSSSTPSVKTRCRSAKASGGSRLGLLSSSAPRIKKAASSAKLRSFSLSDPSCRRPTQS